MDETIKTLQKIKKRLLRKAERQAIETAIKSLEVTTDLYTFLVAMAITPEKATQLRQQIIKAKENNNK